MSVPQHIVDLLEDYLDNTLAPAGRAEIVSWLQQSDANAKALAGWFHDEVELLEAARVADLCAVFEGLSREADTPMERPPTTIARSRRWLPAAIVLAAAASVAIALAYPLIFRRDGHTAGELIASEPAAEPSAATPPATPSPAMLVRLSRCVWAPGMTPLRVGQDVVAGASIEIESGLAQLVFENGAEVVLQGPCSFRVDNAMLCWLKRGSVSAEVPPRAAGFTIRGPSSEVIDLGTRFGFSVGEAGNSEVHVFQGEVISRQLDERGQAIGDVILLSKDQAILFPGERKQAQRLAADEAKFALEVRPLWRKESIEPLVVDRGLALWLRAAHGVQTDPANRVIAWQDLAVGDNIVTNDAFQPDRKARPRLMDNVFGNRPAIRFDGLTNYLTTTPLTTTDDQTIVVAFQFLPPKTRGNRVGGQIVNYNGPPSRYLPNIYSPGVLQLGEKVGDWDGPATSISAKAFVGRNSAGTDVSAGVVRSNPLGAKRLHVVAYVYDNTTNSAQLFVDGQPVAKTSAPTSVAVTSRKVIGKHGIFDQWYFRGDLAEVIIYNNALNVKEIRGLSEQLSAHYGVQKNKEGMEL